MLKNMIHFAGIIYTLWVYVFNGHVVKCSNLLYRVFELIRCFAQLFLLENYECTNLNLINNKTEIIETIGFYLFVFFN
jgi:hypothetical protein